MTGFRRAQRSLVTRLVVALLYAVCILTPYAALAATKAAAHCLTESQASHVHHESAAAPSHEHADGKVHHHDAPEQAAADGDSQGTCCGLFCLTGLATTSVPSTSAPGFAGPIVADVSDALSGRSPERITKPPIT